jgi:5-methylthioadenosine/S-adenosylhomocysteine deaminase
MHEREVPGEEEIIREAAAAAHALVERAGDEG